MKYLVDIMIYRHQPTHRVIDAEELPMLIMEAKKTLGAELIVHKQNQKGNFIRIGCFQIGKQPIHVRRAYGLGVDYSADDVILN